ncbi:MAG: DUF3048 domain-containing protein [Bacilli bacterium]|nr:DUF3048 domain-containing protein [Bacilli bacterium]
MKKKIILFILILLVLGVSIPLLYQTFMRKEKEQEEKTNQPNVKEEKPKPKLKIVNEDSKSRPYAIMINNNQAAWKNHSGINDAYLVYEIITEGGITRMMALFKDKDTERIGSVRSARHYFLDYALENDAIYIHFGWSPKAQSDISNLGINNINGIYDNSFWRDRTLGVAYEHTAFTSIALVKALAEKRNYTRDTNKELLFNYSVEELNNNLKEDAIIANTVVIPYSKAHTTSYQYNAETKRYMRYMNDWAHTDGITKEQYSTKNIIIQKVENYSMDSYGRQDLKTIGSGSGYFVTNGYAVPISWSKENRSSQTKYTYLDGTEISLNDGNTFIQIEPISMTPTFLE